MPGTWPEARAAKANRQAREATMFTADKLGPVCARPGCGLRLPLVLVDQGWREHPMCGPEALELARHGITARLPEGTR